MTQKRKVGPGGGDFALNPNRFSGGGGGRSGASIVKKARKKTAKPESSMKTKKKATRTRRQMERLDEKLNQAHYNQLLKDQRKTTTKRDLKKSPDSRERVNIEGKGGLREDVKAFKKKLERDDTYKGDALRAYRDLHFSKYKAGKPKKEQKRLSKNLSTILSSTFGERRVALENKKDPTVRKVIRKNKKLAKEEFKEQIKKDRAERKADKAKRRRN